MKLASLNFHDSASTALIHDYHKAQLRLGEYSPIFTSPSVNNCFSIITQVIIEIPIKQRNVKILPQFAIVDIKEFIPRCSHQRVTQCLFKLALWRKTTFSLTFIPGKNKSKSDLSWPVLLSTMATLHYSFPKQCFLIASACWASLQKFLKGKSDAYK